MYSRPVQQARPEGVVPPDVGPADVQATPAEIGDAVGARDGGSAPGVVGDAGGEDEAAVGLDLPEGQEIAVAIPGREIRPVGTPGVGDDELGRGAGVIDDDRPDDEPVDALLDHGIGLVAKVAGGDGRAGRRGLGDLRPVALAVIGEVEAVEATAAAGARLAG